MILLWNVAQHFYPNFGSHRTEWMEQLPRALKRAAVDESGIDFELTLRTMVAQLRDGHGTVNSPYGDPRPLPLVWRLLNDRLVVLEADSAYAEVVHRGDEVIAIQGQPVSRLVEDAKGLRSGATDQWLDLRAAEALQVMSRADTVRLDLRSPAGARKTVFLPREAGALRRPSRPDSVTEVAPGVIYLDLARISDMDFQNALPSLDSARGVIFDMRGYPNRISPRLLCHLTDTLMTGPRTCVPVITRPDGEDVELDCAGRQIPPIPPRIKGRAVFLIDASAISRAESFLDVVERYELAELVGEPTAGTTGEITGVELPGGYRVTFTGQRWLRPDGTLHHGFGIQPTVSVSPSSAGIAAGRDEQLDRAIEILLQTAQK